MNFSAPLFVWTIEVTKLEFFHSLVFKKIVRIYNWATHSWITRENARRCNLVSLVIRLNIDDDDDTTSLVHRPMSHHTVQK